MLLIGSGLLGEFLNVYTFMFAAIMINVLIGFNNRKYILSSCHCAYSKNYKDQLATLLMLLFLSFGIVIITADITYSLAQIWFFEKPEPIKTHYINLLVTLSVVFSNMIFKTAIMFLNKNGVRLAERFFKLKEAEEKDNSKGN